MLSEVFICATRAPSTSTHVAITKGVGISIHELQPTPSQKSSFTKSSAPANAVAATPTHIFAAQAEKAAILVYSRERGNQEALVPFTERIHSLSMPADTVLALGTAEGRLILWEVCTGRRVTTSASHLQPISCIAATQSHIVTGSADSNINVWSVADILSLMATSTNHEPLRTFSDHRGAVTCVALGHSHGTTDICVSASEDKTAIVWNYHTGALLRTFLLPAIPLSLVLDPCDRGVYVGYDDGSVQVAEFFDTGAILNPLYDTRSGNIPLQITQSPWLATSEIGAATCLGLSYDGMSLLSGHSSGKVVLWNTGRRAFGSEIVDLKIPITNLLMQSPFAKVKMTKPLAVVKPKLGETSYRFTAQLTGTMTSNSFERALKTSAFPDGMLEAAIASFSRPATSSNSASEQLRAENAELWKVIHEQRALQQKTWRMYSELKHPQTPM